MLKRLKLWLWRLLMSRPRKLKLNGGEVILKNFSVEEADRLTKMLNGESSIVQEIEIPSLEDVQGTLTVTGYEKVYLTNDSTEFNEPMNNYAISLIKENNVYKIVELSFNSNTKQAIVTNIREVGSYKGIADGEFKVLIANKFL